MICSFLDRAVTATMACLFGCFRIQDSPSRLLSQSLPPTDVVTKKVNPLSSLLISEDGEQDNSQLEEKEYKELETGRKDEFDVKQLQDEAKLLKSWGSLLETPSEIRKISMEWKGQSHMGDQENMKFRSWLTDTSIEKISLEKQPNQPPTPVKPNELVKGTVSLEQTPSSCMTNGQHSGRMSSNSAEGKRIQNVTSPNEAHANQDYHFATSSASSGNFAPIVNCRNKSVRFDCKSTSSVSSRSSSSDIDSQNSNKSEVAGGCSMSKTLPYPTPLKLSDDMQTPGTVFPAYQGNMGNKTKTRIRSQYVYSVLNPVENFSQWKVLKEVDSDSNQPARQHGEPLDRFDEASSISEKGMRETSVEKEMVEASLSSWLKQSVTKQEGNSYSISRDNSHCGKSPLDRPIIVMVAAHWNDDESSLISPKWWDGKGIPNSTNKYKEQDQKVSGHATPFEERLEKALSEETFISQREHLSGREPIDFGDNEESDTAVSKLQSSATLKSIVSC